MTRHVRDSAYWGLPAGTPIVAGMRPARAKMAKGAAKVAQSASPPKVQPGAAAAKFTAGPARRRMTPIDTSTPRRAELAKRTATDLRVEARGAGLKPGKASKAHLVEMLAERTSGNPHRVAANAPPKPNHAGRAPGRDISSDVDYKALPATYNAKTGENDALKAIAHRQGFAGQPQVVSAGDFDAAVGRGDVRETWRGLSEPVGSGKAKGLAEQYRSGDFYIGLGINGDGTYVAMSKADGQYYGSTLLRIGLHKDAKVISADQLDAEMDAYFAAKAGRKSAQLRALDEKLLKDLANAKTPRARANIRRKYRNDVDGLDPDRSIALQRDPGIFAALRGYDAIEIPKERSPDNHHEMIILNRTATIVQGA